MEIDEDKKIAKILKKANRNKQSIAMKKLIRRQEASAYLEELKRKL